MIQAENSHFLAIVAYGESTYDFDSREEINEAKQEAELYASARLAKFFNEEISTNETLEKISKKIKEQSNDSKNVNSKILKTNTITINKSAKTLLKGCKVVKQIIDRDQKYVGVWYGFNQKTMKIADNAKNAMNNALIKQNNASTEKFSNVSKKGIEESKSSDHKDFF